MYDGWLGGAGYGYGRQVVQKKSMQLKNRTCLKSSCAKMFMVFLW